MNRRNEKAITLITLVVTIVVLLILAGVSIAMLSGENGIITQANQSKNTTRAAEIQEKVKMAINENVILKNIGSEEIIRETILEELYNENLITDEEYNKLTGQNGETKVNKITIGEIEVDFSGLTSNVEFTTIGEMYSEDMIGTILKNTTLDSNLPEGIYWIILGEDEDGTIMLTTSEPIEGVFSTSGSVANWLTYETDLNTACIGYGATIQNQEIKSRSIDIEDINRVTGFIEPEFNTYTFGNTLDFANKKVNFYHPDEIANNKWSKASITYECNAYRYWRTSNNTVGYWAEETNWQTGEYTRSILKNMDIILGPTDSYEYYLASKSVIVKENYATFYNNAVGGGSIWNGYLFQMCKGESNTYSDANWSSNQAIRPILNVPIDIQVKKVGEEWSIID